MEESYLFLYYTKCEKEAPANVQNVGGNVGHSHVLGEMVHEVLKQIRGYELPKSSLVLHFNFTKRMLLRVMYIPSK